MELTSNERTQVKQMQEKMATLPNGGKKIIEKKMGQLEHTLNTFRKQLKEDQEDLKIMPDGNTKSELIQSCISARKEIQKMESMYRVLNAV